MKKLFLIIAMLAICITGCTKISDEKIKDNFIKETENLKSYYMEGNLKITNNDDNYEYDVEVIYQKDDKYKVSLINKANDYEQIILKNEDVYVITPSINKSFKFQSDWPNNNSQSYLLHSVANDLKNDKAYKFTKQDKDYIFTTKTNYPNNPKYIKQNIILDKNYNLKKVEVQDEQNITYIEFIVKEIDKKATFNEDEFSLEEITKEFSSEINDESSKQDEQNQTDEYSEEKNSTATDNNEKEDENNQETDQTKGEENQEQNENLTEETNETSKIDENIFPLYLPTNTSLTDKEVIETKNGERVIMTFSGDSSFILVQETIKPSSKLEIIPTYGEPFMLIDTVGSLTDTSYTWSSNGIEYYIVSEQMDQKELLEVAKSINVVSAINEK